MKEFKGTPAPWNIDTCPVSGLVITNSDESKALAFLPINGDDSQANSKLVAAAPELLGVLIELLSELEVESLPPYIVDTMIKANQAIDKALGETPIQTP